MNNKTLPLPFILGENIDLELLLYAMDTFADTDLLKRHKEKEKRKAEKKAKKTDL